MVLYDTLKRCHLIHRTFNTLFGVEGHLGTFFSTPFWCSITPFTSVQLHPLLVFNYTLLSVIEHPLRVFYDTLLSVIEHPR